MKKNRFLPLSTLIAMALGLMTTSCVECVGDKSCEQAVRDNFVYVVYCRYSSLDDGTFYVTHTNQYGGPYDATVETDCNCNITYIDGVKQN